MGKWNLFGAATAGKLHVLQQSPIHRARILEIKKTTSHIIVPPFEAMLSAWLYIGNNVVVTLTGQSIYIWNLAQHNLYILVCTSIECAWL